MARIGVRLIAMKIHFPREGELALQDNSGTGIRFEAYAAKLAAGLGHADRVRPFQDYCVGLLSAEGRKSVEPLAALTAPERTAAQHQSLLHFVAAGPWSDATILREVRAQVLPAVTREEPAQALIIDDTSYPKKGTHSVGVTRQYCGERGKQDNCQVAVSLSVATHQASLPIAYQLYLPESWADDAERRAKAGVPADIAFQTKPEIALAQLRAARSAGLSAVEVLADAAYGNDGKFRAGITAEGLPYAVGVFSSLLVWRPGEAPPPRAEGGRRPRLKPGEKRPRPVQVKTLAMELAADAWQTIAWREGSNTVLTSRFARRRVRPAPQAAGRGEPAEPAAEEWLLIEWPEGEAEPTRYWLSTLPADISFERLVDLTKLRWRIERDYQELKQEVGLGHYEGRGWRGFHHHASLCIAAYGFLISERETIPPSGGPRTRHGMRSAVPVGYRPRGAAAAHAASHAKLYRYVAPPAGAYPCAHAPALSLLRPNPPTARFPN
jgi:SRSO17 transposase